MAAFDYKKGYKDLYQPKNIPQPIVVPPMNFIMVHGTGSPDSPAYQNAVSLLYSLTFTIKMSKMGKEIPEGYFEYVVPPLEGLWWMEDGFDLAARDEWLWTSMIRQPEFVTEEVFLKACETLRKKKPDIDVSAATFEAFDEGLCVQIMHIGPFAEEPASIGKIHRFIEENGLADTLTEGGRHHEIYLGDPRKTAPDKLRTIIRYPVKKL